ncbi:AGE family epimerase/isomerase [candidate division KSB1 bacterium]|nr:AGE family epimerase/isomerase [candidate division KSB1 bacterium]
MENKEYAKRVYKELTDNILFFWLRHSKDVENGGFLGGMNSAGEPEENAPKGLILNSRILWTFASVYLFEKKGEYLEMADRAFQYFDKYFYDAENGGYFWMLDYTGQPQDTDKEIYGQAFSIYALAEYYKATKNVKILQKAIDLFNLIEEKCHDDANTGYYERFSRDWKLTGDSRLSGSRDAKTKSMNSHLHILEAFANFYRIWKDQKLLFRLKEQIRIFLDFIINQETFHFILFFDEEWKPQSDLISFGHDIEGSWLLYEAAEVAGDEELLGKVKDVSVKMATACLNEGLDDDSGMLYEANPENAIDSDKHWWPQAEAAVGFLNAYQLTGDMRFYEASVNSWLFIEDYIADRKYGEWVWRVTKDRKSINKSPKISAWKAPYHNSRACIEIINRLKTLDK